MLDFICTGFAELWASAKTKIKKWKYACSPGIEPATPCFPARRSNHSAIEAVNDLLLKLLVYLSTLLSIDTCDNTCMKLILVRCVLAPRAYEKGQRGHMLPHSPRGGGGGTSGFVPLPLFVTGLCHWELSDKIIISFTNIDDIEYCLQNFVWTNQTIINFILALSHVLIHSSVKD